MNIFLRELLNQKKYQEINELLKNGILNEDTLLKELTADEIILLTNKLDISIDKAVDIIIGTKNAEYIYKFAKNVKGALIEKLADAIIATKDAFYIYLFASNIKGAPIEKLADAVIETKYAAYIYEFARAVKGVSIEKFTNAIVETKDARCIYYFAKYIKGASIEKLADAIIETKNAMYICEFASDVKGAPIDKLADAVIETKDVEHICIFASYIKGAPIDKLIDAIIATKNAKSIYHASIVEGAPIDKLTDGIIETKDAEYIHKFINFVSHELEKEDKIEQFKLLIASLIKNGRTDLINGIIDKIKDNPKFLKMARSLLEIESKKQKTKYDLFDELMKLSAQNNYEEILRRKDEFAQIFSDTENMEEINHTR